MGRGTETDKTDQTVVTDKIAAIETRGMAAGQVEGREGTSGETTADSGITAITTIVTADHARRQQSRGKAKEGRGRENQACQSWGGQRLHGEKKTGRASADGDAYNIYLRATLGNVRPQVIS